VHVLLADPAGADQADADAHGVPRCSIGLVQDC
jgi:hypothetical protein